ncbi:GNAT family acetyltransferase, putative [Talaromyces stipitatus ATCC 10500]|uniref:GNAT family acetyltransferase, putative n=1 Tax=Talaromyces stipitatus (strain ATCC 10500 / CBS 375.48 / QM 6759 / NRRL 1006) TaxID=441959 RepID=B8LZW0_TALSN|nr:GNAT family acetyltransferase, putative [Talaromyces stipitatus ATCC 10500]EED20892.1 GNAT family acetyltransferase, putative [Talaromyces stipitatus ATCC 10500]
MADVSATSKTTAQDAATDKKQPPALATFQALPNNEDHHIDRVNALRLIADSVAQQRQEASRAIITHPITIATVLALCAVFSHYIGDLATIVITTAGCLMAGMSGVGYLTYGYLELAERTGTWSFLRADENTDKEDILIVTKYGDDIIGALVLRLVVVGGNKKSPKFKARYRNKTFGTALLEEAIALGRKNGWEGPEFAPDHANSKRILPGIFHKNLDRREARAKNLLEKLKAESK